MLKDADACLTLSAPGIAPLFPDVGDAAFNEPSSLLGAPAFNVPGLKEENLPLGLQLMGRTGSDYDLVGIAGWVARFIEK